MPHYGSKQYWETYYSEKAQELSEEEWLCTKEEMQGWLKQEVTHRHSVLVVGCGLSELPEKMYDENDIRDITCVDWSPTLIKFKTARNSRLRAGLNYHQADMTAEIKFRHFGFDIVIDKGLLDCVLCRKDFTFAATKLLKNVHEMLRPHGRYVVVSSGTPLVMLPILKTAKGPKWSHMEVKCTRKSSLRDVVVGKAADGVLTNSVWQGVPKPEDPSSWGLHQDHIFMYCMTREHIKTWEEEMAELEDDPAA